MGHGRARAIPRDHERLLPRRRGRAPGLRRHQGHHLREREALAQGAPRPRRRQHRRHAHRQQDRPRPPPLRPAGGRGGVRRAGGPVVRRDLGARRHQRRQGVPDRAHGDLPDRQQEGVGVR
uniref:Uncharacterized protein n=1 Tax=Arundo donax TaxID=35708 RepID=A0A0A9GK77_ARUDO